MQTIINDPMVISLVTAMILGMVLGVERFLAHKTAGMRTYALISMGSALFVIISQVVATQVSGMFDPLRMAAQVVAAAVINYASNLILPSLMGLVFILFKKAKEV